MISRLGARGVRFALLDVAPDSKADLLLKNVNIDFIKLGGDISAALRNDTLWQFGITLVQDDFGRDGE